MATFAETGGLSRQRRSLRLSYVLRPGDDGGQEGARFHQAPVNAMACSPGDCKWLFTGSRDGSIRAWHVGSSAASPQQAPTCVSVCEGHSDWVSSLAVVHPDSTTDAAGAAPSPPPLLISGSFDATIALWRPVTATAERASRRSPGAPTPVAMVSPLATFAGGHTDFVTCVATTPGSNMCASAGLGGQLCIWDIGAAHEGVPPLQRIPDVSTRTRVLGAVAASAGEVDAGKWSIYALAMSPGSGAPLLAWGDAGGCIRLWDTRQPAPACWGDAALQGHTDTVRCLLLDAAGGRCVSAGADASVRLWDLRTQRELARLDVPGKDSVWALAPDGPAWRAMFTGHRSGAVSKVRLMGEATTGDVDTPSGVTVLSPRRRSVLTTCAAPVTCMAMAGTSQLWVSTASAGPRSVSLFSTSTSQQQALTTLPGAPGGGLRRAEVCADRRHCVVQNCEGGTSLWDLVLGRPVKDLGALPDWEAARAAAAQHAPPSGLSPWCTVDVRLGGLAVHLDPSSAFGMEAYALDLGVPDAADDQRMNMGHQALCCVLQPWAEHAVAEQNSRRSADSSTPMIDAASPPASREAPRSAFAWPQPPPVLLFQGPDGTRVRRDASALTLDDGALLPGWATEAVLYDPPPNAEPAKLSFYLIPAHGPGALPALVQNRLTAPRILKASKIRKYLASKLDLAEASQQNAGGAAVAWPPVDTSALVQLTCDGKAFTGEATLAQAQAFLWKQSGELTLEYGRTKDGEQQ